MRKKIFKNKTLVIATFLVAALFIGTTMSTAIASDKLVPIGSKELPGISGLPIKENTNDNVLDSTKDKETVDKELIKSKLELKEEDSEKVEKDSSFTQESSSITSISSVQNIEYTTISVPKFLVERIEKKLIGTDFKSVSEYVSFRLEKDLKKPCLLCADSIEIQQKPLSVSEVATLLGVPEEELVQQLDKMVLSIKDRSYTQEYNQIVSIVDAEKFSSQIKTNTKPFGISKSVLNTIVTRGIEGYDFDTLLRAEFSNVEDAFENHPLSSMFDSGDFSNGMGSIAGLSGMSTSASNVAGGMVAVATAAGGCSDATDAISSIMSNDNMNAAEKAEAMMDYAISTGKAAIIGAALGACGGAAVSGGNPTATQLSALAGAVIGASIQSCLNAAASAASATASYTPTINSHSWTSSTPSSSSSSSSSNSEEEPQVQSQGI